MKLSIFTPTHNPKHLKDIYERLLNEDHQDWEWIVVPNGGIDEIFNHDDNRLVVVDNYQNLTNLGIGALKSLACEKATGEVLIELDHDDIPVTGFLGAIHEAFENPNVQFAYTNFAEFHDDENMTPRTFNADCGWRYRDFEFEGKSFKEAVAPPFEPPYNLDITHAPNHFRCWRRSFYESIGGHDASLYVGDDYELLLRTYLRADSPEAICHIDKCLYLYRWTGNNSYLQRDTVLRENVLSAYSNNLFPVLLKWAKDNNLQALDLGAAHSPADGFIGVDITGDAAVKADLSKPWPFKDNSVGVIRAFDFVEHLEDKIHFMNEAYRVLAPNGALIIHVPSSEGWGAHQDPTHLSFWNPNSFWYFTNDNYKKYCPSIACSYMPYKIIHHFPSDFHKTNNIPYVQAHLFSLKDYGNKWAAPMPCMMPHKSENEPRVVEGTVVTKAKEGTVVNVGDMPEADGVWGPITRVDHPQCSENSVSEGKYEKQVPQELMNLGPIELLEVIDIDPEVPNSKLQNVKPGRNDKGESCLIATYVVNRA